MPDYRGLFLRGLGSKSFNSGGYGNINHESEILGKIQGDTIRNITGSIKSGGYGMAYTQMNGSGVFSSYVGSGDVHSWGGSRRLPFGVYLDLSKLIPTSNENRPINCSVRYLIRAQL